MNRKSRIEWMRRSNFPMCVQRVPHIWWKSQIFFISPRLFFALALGCVFAASSADGKRKIMFMVCAVIYVFLKFLLFVLFNPESQRDWEKSPFLSFTLRMMITRNLSEISLPFGAKPQKHSRFYSLDSVQKARINENR